MEEAEGARAAKRATTVSTGACRTRRFDGRAEGEREREGKGRDAPARSAAFWRGERGGLMGALMGGVPCLGFRCWTWASAADIVARERQAMEGGGRCGGREGRDEERVLAGRTVWSGRVSREGSVVWWWQGGDRPVGEGPNRLLAWLRVGTGGATRTRWGESAGASWPYWLRAPQPDLARASGAFAQLLERRRAASSMADVGTLQRNPPRTRPA